MTLILNLTVKYTNKRKGSSPSPIVADILLKHFETHCLAECPINIKSQFYRRYLDGKFLIFRKEDQAKQFFSFMNNRHKNIKFTFEGEPDQSIAFQNVSHPRKRSIYYIKLPKTDIYRTRTEFFLQYIP